MAISFGVSRVAKFVGVIDLYLRTLTTTYVPAQGGWRFLQGAPYPMAQWQRRDAGNNAGQVTGIIGSVFDALNVHTDYLLGTSTDAFPANNTSTAVWVNNCLMGMLDLGGAVQPIALESFNYGFVPGAGGLIKPLSYVQREPSVGHVLAPMVLTNTNRAMYSAAFGVGHRFIYTTAPNDICLGFVREDNAYSAFLSVYQATVVANAQPATLLKNPLGPGYFANTNTNSNVSPNLLLQSDDTLNNWLGISLTWDDAAINTDMQKLAGGFVDAYPSPFGWVSELNLTTAKGLTGFVVLTSPDGSTYQVLNIIPTDAQSKNWKGAVGQGYAMLDPSGLLWSHQINQDGIVYTSSGSVIKQLPIFPPVALPPPPRDTQVTLKTFR